MSDSGHILVEPDDVSRSPNVSATKGTQKKRCHFCKKDRKKCEWVPDHEKCSRCEQLNYTCSFDGINPKDETHRRTLNKYKCTFCRDVRVKCLPTDRVWPQRCQRCIRLRLVCSEPHNSFGVSTRAISVASDGPSMEQPQNGAESLEFLSTANVISGNIGQSSTAERSHRVLTLATPHNVEEHPLPIGATLTSPEETSTSIRRGNKRVRLETLESTFKHQSLQGSSVFRLVILYPGNSIDDPIHCEIIHSDFDIQYEAISYAWEYETPPAPVKIVVKGKTQQMFVRGTVHSALRSLRHRDKTRALWIDGLCINWEDQSERSSQLQLMAKIFTHAQNACVWLGDSNRSAELAFELMPRLLNLAQFNSLVAEESLSEHWAAVIETMSRTYFERRWCVQEIALSKTAILFCGTSQLLWSDFSDIVSLMSHVTDNILMVFRRSQRNDYHPNFSGDIETVPAVRFVRAVSSFLKNARGEMLASPSTSIESLVYNLSFLKVSDPRDTIYALISIASDVFPVFSGWKCGFIDIAHVILAIIRVQKRIRRNPKTSVRARHSRDHVRRPFLVSYKKDPISVFVDFTRYCLKADNSLDILCRPWAPTLPSATTLPSWIVPIDRASFGPQAQLGRYERINATPLVGSPDQPKSYAASLTSTPSWSISSSNVLTVDGFILDRVSRVQTAAIAGNISASWLRLAGWADRQKTPPDRFWRTLVANRTSSGEVPPKFWARACQFVFSQTGVNSAANVEALINTSFPDFVTDFLHRVKVVVWNRQLMETEGKRLGLAPESAEHGDLICILYGCSVPVILRPTDGPSSPDGALMNSISMEAYELIGECYVEGMMDGGALQLEEALSRENRFFDLV